jgi:hypothetical protein
MMLREGYLGGSADDGVVHQEHDDRADDGDDHAVEIEPGDPTGAECGKEEATDDSADDAKDNIDNHALSGSADDPARDVTRDKAEDQPRYYSHEVLSVWVERLLVSAISHIANGWSGDVPVTIVACH